MTSFLFQENRVCVSLRQSVPTDQIFVPTSSSSAFHARDFPKRRCIDPAPTFDDVAFTERNLAVESSVYFRSHSKSPFRSILWRILDHRQVLELQAVDLYINHSNTTQPVTLKLRFDSPLIPHGASFAETQDTTSALLVHVVTKRGEVASLRLPDEALSKQNVLQEGHGAKSWWKTTSPSALKVRPPYRVVASQSENGLWVALNDGSLLRLQQQNRDENWREVIYSNATWTSSVKSLVSWKAHSSISYGDIQLSPRAASAMDVSPSGFILWCVSLDHVIRAWSIATGKVALTMDLSGDESRDQTQPSIEPLDPHANKLLQIIQLSGHSTHKYILVAYSPHHRLFKFWTVEEQQEELINVTLSSMFDNFEFRPPVEDLIDTVGWHLVDFHFTSPHSAHDRNWALWMLIRSGSRSHTFNIDFNPEERKQKLSQTWRRNWAEVHQGFASLSAMKADLSYPSDRPQNNSNSASIERWLDWLVSPGRFSTAVLEAALGVYERGHGGQRTRATAMVPATSPSFKQRLSTAITLVVPKYKFDSDDSFVDHYQLVSNQISTFVGVLEDLQRQRERVTSLAVDTETGTPWLLMADQASVIRNCSDLELMYHNAYQYADRQGSSYAGSLLLKSLSDSMSSNMGALTCALRNLRSSFSREFMIDFRDAFLEDIFHGSRSNRSAGSRIEALCDITDYRNVFDDTAFQRVTDPVDRIGGFGSLPKSFFVKFLELFDEKASRKAEKRIFTTFGTCALVAGARDTTELEVDLLLDVILFSIFLHCDIEPSELSHEVSAAEIYVDAAELVKERLVSQWLLTAPSILKSSLNLGQMDISKQNLEFKTLLELQQVQEWSSRNIPRASQMKLLQHWSRIWLFPKDTHQNYDEVVPKLMIWLLKNVDTSIAGKFIDFLPNTSWADYVKARYNLVAGEYVNASTILTAIAEHMSIDFNVDYHDSGNLLTPQEEDHFRKGLAEFYFHAMSLFQSHEVPGIAHDFAKLALKAVEEGNEKNPSLKSRILSQLFAISLKISRFEDSFHALRMQTDLTLRRRNLQEFLKDILSASNINVLLHLPWSAELAADADAYLAELCTKSHADSESSTLKDLDESIDQDRLPPHRLLYAWRVQRGDFRGAAAALWESVQSIKGGQYHGIRGNDVDSELQETYLSLINCLILVEERMRWLLVRPVEADCTSGHSRFANTASASLNNKKLVKRGPRKIVTVEDVRQEYQQHLDRVADYAAGRFPLQLEFTGDDNGDDGGSDERMQVDTDALAFGGLVPEKRREQPMEVDVSA